LDRKIFSEWLGVNLTAFSAAFLSATILNIVSPSLALQALEGWLFIIKLSLGGAFSQLYLQGSDFLQILLRNSLSVMVVFTGGLSLVSPLIMMLCGLFYALNLFCIPWSPKILSHVLALAAIEISFFLLTASFSSALAGEAFGVDSSWRSLLKYWKRLKSVRDSGVKPSWLKVFGKNRRTLSLYLIAVTALLLSGAIFEAWLLLSY
jgi:hypothetical protein